MILRYAVNNRFNNEDHWVCFPHYINALLYAMRINSKVVRIKEMYK